MDTSVNSSGSFVISQFPDCSKSRTSIFVFMSWFIAYILFLPVFIFVLYIGYQRWRKQRSVSMATHSDVFTFHMIAVEMMHIVASCFYCKELFTGTASLVGEGIAVMVSYGQLFFHVLTCLERYLAVVHPITYQSLKQVGGVRIRNLSIGCAWLMSCGLAITTSVVGLFGQNTLILGLFIMFLCAAFISFCSFSVLCGLIRPGPGEVGRDRKLTNKSKQRALNTMMTILGVLLLKLIAYLIMFISFLLVEVTVDRLCAMQMSSLCFNLPSSLVLPLLFLHRAGKLPDKQKEIQVIRTS